MKKYNAGIIGATGMVGQRFAALLAGHPWFEVSCLAASPRSAGRLYGDITAERRLLGTECPEKLKDMTVIDASDIETVTGRCDLVFSAVDMRKEEIYALEEAYAKHECPVMSNNSAHRMTPDVPIIVAEVNPEHADIIPAQRGRLGTKRGFISVQSNCSIQSYMPALTPLLKYGISDVLVCTYQAISGAGKTFETWPEMIDNVIPYIGGEEEKSEQEPLKIWGRIEGGVIKYADKPNITSQCIRVPVTDGHLAAVFVRFENKPSKEQILADWKAFKAADLPSAPKIPLTYFEEENYPQTKLHRGLEGGMGFSAGRLRPDSQYDYKFIGLSHNTLRGAAGGAVLMAELLAVKKYFD